MVGRILDVLRGIFIYALAIMLPFAGVMLAILKFTEHDREEGVRIAAATVLGVCCYALLLSS